MGVASGCGVRRYIDLLILHVSRRWVWLVGVGGICGYFSTYSLKHISHKIKF